MATLDQSFTAGAEGTLNPGSSAGQKYICQQFTTGQTGNIAQVDLELKKSGTPTGTLYATVYSDNGSDYPNVAITDSISLDVSTLTTSYAYISFAFTTKPLINSGVKLWIVISLEATVNTIYWQGSTSGGYTGGITAYGAVIGELNQLSSYDQNFKEYYDSAATGYSNLLTLGVG